MEAQIRTLEQQEQQNLQRNVQDIHICMHFLGKLQIFQIFTYNIFSDNSESKWTSEIFNLDENLHQWSKKNGGMTAADSQEGKKSHTSFITKQSLHVGTAVTACQVTLFKNILSKLWL